MNKNQEYQIGIHIDVPEKISRKIVSVQNDLGLVHPSGDLKPHITLYYGRFMEGNFETLVGNLKDFSLPKFNISVDRVRRQDDGYPNDAFFSLELKDSDQVEKIHRTIIEIVSSLRGGLLRTKDILRKERGELTKRELEYLEKYGSYRVMDNFNSHITLGVCSKKSERCDSLLVSFEKEFTDILGTCFEVDIIVVVAYVYDNEKEKIVSELDRRIIKLV